MDIDSFIMHIKTEDFYKDIADDVEKRFDTSNYEVDRPLPKGKNKKVIGLMKHEEGGRIMRRNDYDRICSTYTKNIILFNG